ncbi:unnamed protein product [Ambrosiozyma monospora]|uniref:Unnamed protein product n=1 Tax=Ambrosiozyma monospora TaxID=43982 RepID=A0ACB5STQ8_AMBMO|nr:unnamed protein product [Ambrosiozyma monospora]
MILTTPNMSPSSNPPPSKDLIQLGKHHKYSTSNHNGYHNEIKTTRTTKVGGSIRPGKTRKNALGREIVCSQNPSHHQSTITRRLKPNTNPIHHLQIISVVQKT